MWGKETGSKTSGRLYVRKAAERVVWGHKYNILKICSSIEGMNS